MATLTLKGRTGALIERAKAVQSKLSAKDRWADGKISKAELQRVTSKANEKLRT